MVKVSHTINTGKAVQHGSSKSLLWVRVSSTEALKLLSMIPKTTLSTGSHQTAVENDAQ